MPTLPTNRTTSNTDAEHVSDHNILHAQHNDFVNETPTSLKNRANHTGTQPISSLSDHTAANHNSLGLSHDSLVDVSIDDHHARDHADSHLQGGIDEIDVIDLGAAGASGYVLERNGNGALQWILTPTSSGDLTVRKNSGADIGQRPRLNFIEGANITMTITDDAGDSEVDITIAATGGGGGSADVDDILMLGGM